MIKLKCNNEMCGYCYEVSQKELEEHPDFHKKCLICGSQLVVANLDEIVFEDVKERVKQYID